MSADITAALAEPESTLAMARGYLAAEETCLSAIEQWRRDEAIDTLTSTLRNATKNAVTLSRALLALAAERDAMAKVVEAAEAYVVSMQTSKALSLDGLAYRELHVAKNRAALIASVAERRAALAAREVRR